MAVKLFTKKDQSLTAVSRTLEHKSGVNIVIEYDGSKGFERAYARLQEVNAEEKEAGSEVLLSKEFNTEDRMTAIERQLFVMGEFLIKEWEGVEDEDGKPLPVNGKNLIELCAFISEDQHEQVEFMADLFKLIGEVTAEFAEANDKTKKKQSKSTSTAKKQ